MKPRAPEPSRHDDLFRMKLQQLINQRHELCRLARVIDWQRCADQFGALYAEEGRPGLPVRLMVGLHYLKHAFNESDESVVARWVENPYWQYFCGEAYFSHRLPLDQSMASTSKEQSDWLQQQVAQLPKGSNTLIITHLPNISAAFPDYANGLADGEALIFGPTGKAGSVLLARVKIEAWPTLGK